MRQLFCISFLFLFTGCALRTAEMGPTLVSIQLVDRSGVQETISQKERLERYKTVSFLEPQPYEKVTCHYKQKGVPISTVISYHKNGQPMQVLEVVALRANGSYREFFENGKIKLEAEVIEGIGDITPYSQESWVFDGISKVYHETGSLKASIPYKKGILEGTSVYYREDGSIWRKTPFIGGECHGEELFLGPLGEVVGGAQYFRGELHGKSWMSAPLHGLNGFEIYSYGKLLEGEYRNAAQELVSEVHDGFGTKSIYEKGILIRTEEVQNGGIEGKIAFYNQQGHVERSFMQKGNLKDGEEWFFHLNGKPKLKVVWENDQIHGVVQSWYDNGMVESERMYGQNKKEGSAFAWYQDGDRMLIEEYENDLLINGRYYKKGDQEPVSRVKEGDGTVTLYDAKGNFLKKIVYKKGLPTNG
ncbi:MAG: toxin-antitoxin system YwqK family antitoxin [Chlamydiia bacterium]